MFDTGNIIDGKYRVDGLCSDSGGMGAILFVTPVDAKIEDRIVLKYCREESDECLRRFKREVRLLRELEGNSRVVQVVDFNLDYDPPYLVMKYYEIGDLSNLSAVIQKDYEVQEKIFTELIECIAELHARDKFHRDIKPQNFLLDADHVIVSDFGLSMEVGSSTGFTRNSVYWGTPGYLPPEFQHGGFKHADAAGDIFMLGKTMYALITDRDPIYLVDDNIPSPIFHIIERCCALDKARRYQSLAQLKQSLTAAYDVLLHRTGGLGETRQLLTSILDRLEQERKYHSSEVIQFIEKLSLLETPDKIRMCFEVKTELFNVLKQEPLVDHLEIFLSVYQKMVESDDYGWSYAETIADNMKILFVGEHVPYKIKAKVLELAIDAAYRMNRFAAMDTCRNMITKITDEKLALAVTDVLFQNAHTFITNIEPSECQSDAVRHAIRRLGESE